MLNPIHALAEAIEHKQAAVLATVIEIKGASPAKVGAQIVLRADGPALGTVGGGKLEAAILADAQAALADGQPRLTHYRLTEEGPEAVGVLCGGEVRAGRQPMPAFTEQMLSDQQLTDIIAYIRSLPAP
jgi:xanthine dehydrogenase accessory factor